ncbi:MAG: phospholipid carrier-dependent glycosyltransferase [Thermoguttaceae bacterium]|nr:phospholipid carrier-dependent glycosyltransferase [Thermoguttaceae bacterium]
MDRRLYCIFAALILLAAFVLRLGGAAVLERFTASHGEARFFFGDSDSYWQLGRALATGAPYEHDEERRWQVFRMPGYPLVLAPLFWVSDDPPVRAARFENVFLGTLTVLLTGWAALAIFRDRWVALWGMGFVAVLPELVVQSAVVLSEELSCVLNLALLLAAVALARNHFSARWGACVGFFWALGVYARPDALLLPPFVACVTFLFPDARRFVARYARRAGVSLIVAFAVFSALMTPWWIRNVRLTGRFVPTTLQVGASLYDGLSPTADGGSDMAFVDRFRDELDRAIDSEGNRNGEFYEARLDRTMKDAALRWAKENPGKAIRLAGVKFLRLWNVVPNEPAFSNPAAKWTIFLSFTPLLLAALWGVWKFRGVPLARLLWIPAAYITLLHMIFVASLRYRAPILPELTILAAAALFMPPHRR